MPKELWGKNWGVQMKQDYYKKIERYLYHLYEPEVLVEDVRQYYINRMNYSPSAWLRGGNTMENQVIKMMESNQLKEIQRWVEFLKNLLTFFKQEKPRFYGFIRLRYLRKRSDEDIKSVMQLDTKEFKELKKEVIECIYIKAILEGLIKEN